MVFGQSLKNLAEESDQELEACQKEHIQSRQKISALKKIYYRDLACRCSKIVWNEMGANHSNI